MRFSQLFGKTLRHVPADVSRTAEQLAMRAAMMRRFDKIPSFLPLGQRVLRRIEQLTAEALANLGGQEATLFVNEKSIAAFINDIASYRDLPRLVYRAAIPRQFTAASLHAERSEFESGFRAIYHTHLDILTRCGVTAAAVEAGPSTTSFVMPNPLGNTALQICESKDCGYASVADLAEFNIPDGVSGEPKPLTKVETPHCPTIAALADFLKLETRQTIKAMMYVLDEEEFVFVVIRGDLDVSEAKLWRVLDDSSFRAATEAEIAAAGAAPGYASPVGLKVAANVAERGKGRVMVVADRSILVGANFAAGANEAGYHFINVNFPRDFQATIVADVALAEEGAKCARCGSALTPQRAFVLGGCHSIGPTDLTYLAEAGRPESVWLGRYWLNPEQLMLSIIDQNHDDAGILWPEAVAPFDIHLIRLGKAAETLEAADKLYTDLQSAGREVLYDDRDESAGVKFADADLIGIPLRVTVSDKSLKAGGAEVKRRTSAEKSIVPLETAVRGL